MKYLVIADWHNATYDQLMQIKKFKDTDLKGIISLGDIDLFFIKKIKEMFPHLPLMYVLGNHDNISDWDNIKDDFINCHNKSIENEGVIFSGLEGCNRYRDTNYLQYTQEEATAFCEKFKKDTNIIISHNSPYKVHNQNEDSHVGFYGLNKFIKENNPKLCLHGHQHINSASYMSDTIVIGIHGAIILDVVDISIEEIFLLEG